MRVEERPTVRAERAPSPRRPLPYPLVVDVLDLDEVVRADCGAPQEGVAPVGDQHDCLRPA